ncbi:cytochrome c551 [Pseudalkalibacillus caeni]|uniref:Cytochrome c n=1 Tax=Exobacillus caeni TaxID=2574798 RepID=A0A5R9EY97_9BACL|nr:cytochrome c [Pseudalkalibacillus caeni]TLS36107.1 cytochrome c [Pseudalkalibacillus caeni]
MKKLLTVSMSLALAIGLTACGGSEESSSNNTGSNGNSDGGATTVDASAAEEVFQQSCAGCHGGNLEGVSGPALKNVGSKLSEDEILTKIQEGGNGMPAGLVKDDKAQNLAAWLAEKE